MKHLRAHKVPRQQTQPPVVDMRVVSVSMEMPNSTALPNQNRNTHASNRALGRARTRNDPYPHPSPHQRYARSSAQTYSPLVEPYSEAPSASASAARNSRPAPYPPHRPSHVMSASMQSDDPEELLEMEGGKASKVKYYAVLRGRVPGIYTNWNDCLKQVNKFPGAIHKSFKSLAEAKIFAQQNDAGSPAGVETMDYESQEFGSGPSETESPAVAPSIAGQEWGDYVALDGTAENKLAKPSTPTTIEAASESAVLANSSAAADATHLSKSVASPAPAALPPPSAEFTVYIDGACSNNGQAGAKAGYGVYWGPNHPLNVAEPVPGPDKHQTNNRAELLAAITVLKAAQTHLEPTAQLTIYSDSQYVLGGVQGWLECWKKSAWQRKGDGTVLNLDLWKELDSCLSIYNRSHRPAIWLWVKGHSGNVGNDQADRHAVLGAAKQRN